MTKLGIAKMIFKCVIASGVGTVVRNAIRSTTPISLSVMDKVLVSIGEFTLGSAAGAIVADHVMKEIQEGFSKVKEIKEAKEDK
jgi:hypothetical protein